MKLHALLLATLMCGNVHAKSLEYNYVRLNNVKAYVCVRDAVDIYKKASKSAPSLMYGCNENTGECAYKWSDLPDKYYDYQPLTLDSGMVKLATMDSSAKGFACITVGETDYFFKGYVTKSALTEKELVPITRDELVSEYFGYWLFPKGSGLEDVIIALDSDEEMGKSNLMLGALQDGMLVFSHNVPCQFQYDADTKGLRFDRYVIYYGPDKCRPLAETSNLEVLDLGKLTAPEKEELLTFLQASEKPNIILARAKYKDCDNCAPAIHDIYVGERTFKEFTTTLSTTLSF